MERGSLSQQPKRLLKEQYMEVRRSFNIFQQQVSGLVPLHWHEFYEMCLITDGGGTHVLNGASHRLQRGSLFLSTPADFHEVYPDEGSVLHIYNVIFSDEMLVEELRELLLYGNAARMTELGEDTLDWVEREYQLIERETREKKTGQHLIVKGALERILIVLLRQREATPYTTQRLDEGTAGHTGVAKALVLIHHHFREPLSLLDAAREAQLAPGYFSECFHRTTGSTFQHYLQNLRLGFAASLLHASKLPITEICHASGFRTLTHFERVFKAKYSRTPREYQQSGRWKNEAAPLQL
ncbi:MAG: AraC family transcriptional regulator [Paenibacillus sp.]|nr:AraC family transcriptional regulator [Paenibacillus sp.]